MTLAEILIDDFERQQKAVRFALEEAQKAKQALEEKRRGSAADDRLAADDPAFAAAVAALEEIARQLAYNVQLSSSLAVPILRRG